MKILIINGSPRGKRGHTEKVIAPFVEGAMQAGAEVEVINLKRMKLQPCNGCFNCWFKTPGVCVINDDVHMLKEKVMNSDVFILATPIYMFSVTGSMKIFMDRVLFPFAMPDFALMDDKLYHPARYPDKKLKTMMITVSAFDGEDVTKPVIDSYQRTISCILDGDKPDVITSVGNITVGFSMLLEDEAVRQKCRPLFENLKKAGAQLAQNLCISKELLDEVNKPIYVHAGLSRQEAVDMDNRIIKYNVDTCKAAVQLYKATNE